MMKTKKGIIALTIFIMLMLTLAIEPVNAEVTNILIVDDDGSITSNNFIIDSDGYYYVLYENATDNYLTIYRSIDDGDTWSFLNQLDVSSYQISEMETCIDSEDRINIVWEEAGNPNDFLFCRYSTNGDTFSSIEEIKTADSWTYHDIAVTVDRYDNIYYFISRYATTGGMYDGTIYCYIYNDQLEQWGVQRTIKNYDGDATSRYQIVNGLSADTDSNGYVYCSYIYSPQNNPNTPAVVLVEYQLDNDAFYIQTVEESNQIASSESGFGTALCVDSSDNIHIAYTNYTSDDADRYISYGYGTNDSGFSTAETIYFIDGKDNYNPTISYSLDGEIHIGWIGQNNFVTTDYPLGKDGNTGEWGQLVYYIIGSTDSFSDTVFYYQNYPSHTLNDGVIGSVENTTDNSLMLIAEGTQVIYGATPTDVCYAQYSYFTSDGGSPTIKSLTTTTVDWYMPSFAEGVIINCLEWNVGSDQITQISDSASDYLLYLNGVSLGNPDEVGTTTLYWNDINQNIGDNDIIIEGVCGAGVYFGDTIYYWRDLELDNQGEAFYSSYNATEIGNGVVDGDPMFTYMDKGLDFVFFYNITGATTDCNTITTTMLSDENLTAYEYLRIQIDIDGSDMSQLEIYNNDTNTYEGGALLTGDQNFEWKWLVMPQNVDTGNHSVRIAEVGCTDYVWEEFYINLTGFTEDDWDLRVSSSSVQAGTPFNIDFKAPVNQTANISIAVGWEVFPTLWLGTYAGTGSWVDDATQYTPFQKCRVFLMNDTSGEIMKFIEVNIYGDTQNLLVVSPKSMEIGETVYFDGTYVNADAYAYLRIISPSGVHYGTVCYQGVIDWEYLTDEAGSWSYSLLLDGNVQSWSEGTFFVYSDDDGGGGILPEVDEFYKNLGSIMIIGFFTTIPLLMSIGLNKTHQINIPWVAYIIFAVIGVLTALLLGWLETAYMFFIVAVGIIIIVAMWLLGRQNNGGSS